MRRAAGLLLCTLALLSGCAHNNEDDQARTDRESGGTIPWNRPEKWEGAGALGSQMNQFSQ